MQDEVAVVDETEVRRRELAREAAKLAAATEELEQCREALADARKGAASCQNCGTKVVTLDQRALEGEFRRASMARTRAEEAWQKLRRAPFVAAELVKAEAVASTEKRRLDAVVTAEASALYDAEQALTRAQKIKDKEGVAAATKVRDAAGEREQLARTALERAEAAERVAVEALDEAHARALRLEPEGPGGAA